MVERNGGLMKQALLFLQKKKQKNSFSGGVGAPAGPKPAASKSFLLLFLKKEALSLAPAHDK
jgi:hypothetical protein